MKKHEVVKFHTPMSDENPAARYLLRDDPTECREHADAFNKKWPHLPPTRAKVDIEYLGEIVDGKMVPTTMFLRPINIVYPEDLEADPTLVYAERNGDDFEIRPA